MDFTQQELRKIANRMSYKYSLEKIAKTLGVTEKTVFNWVYNSTFDLTEDEWDEIKSVLEQAQREVGPSKCEECQCNTCRWCKEWCFDRELGGCELGACATCNGYMRKKCPNFEAK
ncbi:MAG: helix-turn-helix domain-containing protein [Bacillota bacterium]